MTNSYTKEDTQKMQDELTQEMVDDLAIANNLFPIKKQEMLIALEKSLGIITPACKAVGIARQTHYRWLEEDELYKRLVKDVQMTKRDFNESALYQLVQKGNVQATLYANRINKDRGYSDSLEHTGADREPIKFVTIKTYEKED
jgi:hypothetical protein|tara:strand:+ start:10586 stop:11017 length:432 start_codon:yes stop_codon:yes gene_type:complete